ncbi:MAG: ester cyclase [Chloroflexota bacterium]|nr:ester cyclase [Chloroflexota bacterium]
MSERAKMVARGLREELVTNGDMALADEILADDFRYHGPPSLGAEPSNREGFKQLIAAYRHAFPDLRETVDDQFVAGDRVVQFTTSRGTFTGEMMGMEPTGKAYAVSGIEVVRVVDGRIVETRIMFDSLGLVQQTGMSLG